MATVYRERNVFNIEDPSTLSILSRITPRLIDDADRALLGDTLAHMAAKPGNSIIDAFKTCNTIYRLVAPLRLPIYNVGETLLDKSI